MSHIKHQVTIQSFTRDKVMHLLDITAEQYGTYLMQQAYAYLQQQLGDNIMGRELATNSLFWAWWRNHWHDVDMDFLDEAKHMNVNERNIYYSIVHDIGDFDYTPQKAILLDAFKSGKTIIKHQL